MNSSSCLFIIKFSLTAHSHSLSIEGRLSSIREKAFLVNFPCVYLLTSIPLTSFCLSVVRRSWIIFTLESSPTHPSSSLPIMFLRPRHNPPRLRQPSRHRPHRFRFVVPYRRNSPFSVPSNKVVIAASNQPKRSTPFPFSQYVRRRTHP